MKKSLLALGVLGACSCATYAQSSVTLYGLIDEGLDYTNNAGGHSLVALSSGDALGSNWGIKGVEDLGGGLSANFQLENGFNVNNGRLSLEGQEFGRQALIGLGSTALGTITLGRQYDSLVDYLAPLTANGNWGGAMFAHPYDNDNTDNTFRLNNALKYTSIDYGGFSFGGAYAFSNSTRFAENRALSIGARYTQGPLSLAVAYLNVDSPNDGASGAVAIGPNGNPDGSWSAARQRVIGAGINYTMAAATLGFVYTNTNLSQPTATQYANLALVGAQSLKFNNFELNAKYQCTSMFYVAGMYTYSQASYDAAAAGAKARYHQFGLMADYNLSKRTDVYVQGTYIKVAGGDVAGTGLEFAANIDAAGPSSTSKQLMARVGIRHQF